LISGGIALPERGQDGDSGVEIRLGDLEERVEIAAFLATLASINLVVWSAVLPIAGAIARTDPAGARLLFYAAAIVLFYFLWSWAISQVWRAPILLGVLVTGGVLAVYPVAQWLRLKTDLGWTLNAVFLATALISASFGVRILRDGWRLSRTPEPSARLLATVPFDRLAPAQALAHASGIHPICRWLPSRPRRSATTLLFVLATVALTGALGLAVYVVVTVLPTEAPAMLDICIRQVSAPGAAVRAGCAGSLVGTIIVPFALIAICLAVAAGLRGLAQRSARMSLAAVSRSDRRPAILFLRSFLDDQIGLVLPRRPLLRRILAIGEPAPRLDHLLLEEATPSGPVVAIGLPGVRPPFGAARVYVHDDEWKSAVAGLAAAARAIVVVIDDTDGVLWELGHIRQAGLAEKTLYLLPPRLSGSREAERILRRELAETSGAFGAILAVPDDAADPYRVFIGWYHGASGELKVLTAAAANSTSYVCALRLALRPWSDHRLIEAGLSHGSIDRTKRPARSRSRLIEALVVLGMLVPVAAIAGLDLWQSRGAARTALARAEVSNLVQAVERYRLDVGDYPPADPGLRALLQAPPRVAGWNGPYLAGQPGGADPFLDPWGRPFIYRAPGANGGFEILSLGRDGRPGGTGEDADVTGEK
jgi:general secretion pathway protein G